jgi:hypothetical protein
MTFEEMQEKARQIVAALNEKGYHATLLEDDMQAGDPLPIGLVIDGEEFVLSLDVM